MENHACEVVEDAEGHEGEDKVEADGVDAVNGFVGELAASDDLDEGEEDVATVEHGDGEEVHEGQHKADEGRHAPEGKPIEGLGEEAADSAEGAYALGAVLREDVAEAADVVAESLPAMTYTRGHARKNIIGYGLRLVVVEDVVFDDAEFACVVEREGDGVDLLRACTLHGDGSAENLVEGLVVGGSNLVMNDEELLVELVPGGESLAVEAYNLVALVEAGLGGGATHHDAVEDRGNGGSNEGVGVLEVGKARILVEGYADGLLLTTATHGDGLCFEDGKGAAPTLDVLAVDGEDDVAVLEAKSLGLGVEHVTVGHVLGGHVLFAPMEEDGAVDDEGGKEVDEDAAHHNEEALPSGLVHKHLLLGRVVLLEVFSGSTLVDHAGDVDVAAKGEPADVVIGAAEGEELPIYPGVKEDAEFLDANAEELRKEEVAALVENDENHEAAEELHGFNQEYGH